MRLPGAGAAGSLGHELLSVLEEERFLVADLTLFAGDHSLCEELSFHGESIAVASEPPPLRGLDLIILCTPAAASLELIRSALRAEVPCLDCSGVLADSSEVPLVVADLGAHDRVCGAPLIGAPEGTALSWSPVLSALQREAGLSRVFGTVMQSASAAGRAGVKALSRETIALLNQAPMPESEVFEAPVAFDCVPLTQRSGGAGDDAEAEEAPSQPSVALARLLGPGVRVAAIRVQVPTFGGEASALAVETERPLGPEQAARVLEEAPGVELWSEGSGPSTRDAVGSDVVLVGRVCADSSQAEGGCGLLLWLAADPIRLAACNAAKLVRARFALASAPHG